jgi:hypothetical protein
MNNQLFLYLILLIILLVPMGQPNAFGQYFWHQILEGQQYSTRTGTTSFNSFGIKAGLAFSFRSHSDIGINEPGINKTKKENNNRGYVVGDGGVARTKKGEVRFKAGAELADKVKKMKFIIVHPDDTLSEKYANALNEELKLATEEIIKLKDQSVINPRILDFINFIEKNNNKKNNINYVSISVSKINPGANCPPANCGCSAQGGIECACTFFNNYCLRRICLLDFTIEEKPLVAPPGGQNNDTKFVFIVINRDNKLSIDQLNSLIEKGISTTNERAIGFGQVTEILKVKHSADIGVNEPGVNRIAIEYQ